MEGASVRNRMFTVERVPSLCCPTVLSVESENNLSAPHFLGEGVSKLL